MAIILNTQGKNIVSFQPKSNKSFLYKIANLLFWLSIILFISSLIFILLALYLFKNGIDPFPYTWKSPEKVPVATAKEGYKIFVQKYPDYTNGKTRGFLDYLIYIPENYTYYTFEYPYDWEVKNENSYQYVKPGPSSEYYSSRGSSQISVRKEYYIETYSQWHQNPDNRVEVNVSFGDFTGTHETADNRQNWSLFYKNRKDFEYHFNLSPRSAVGDRVLQEIVDSFQVHEMKIKVPWYMHPLGFAYQALAIIDIIIPIF